MISTVVELVDENAVPGVFTGSRAAGKGKEVGAVGHACRCAGLDGAGADFLEAQPPKQLAEAGNLLLEHRVEGFGCDVTACHPGAPGRQHNVDGGVGNPLPQSALDGVPVVGHDASRDHMVTRGAGAVGQGVSGAVVGFGAGVGHGEDGDLDRHEGSGGVDSGHGGSCTIGRRR